MITLDATDEQLRDPARNPPGFVQVKVERADLDARARQALLSGSDRPMDAVVDLALEEHEKKDPLSTLRSKVEAFRAQRATTDSLNRDRSVLANIQVLSAHPDPFPGKTADDEDITPDQKAQIIAVHEARSAALRALEPLPAGAEVVTP